MKSEKVKGSKVDLVPYLRGYSDPALLGRLWWLMRQTPNAAAHLFWSQKVEHERMRGDLESFVIASRTRSTLAVYPKNSNELGGMVFFEEIVPKERANIGLFYVRKLWGHPAREATVLATRWAFETFELKTIWGITPFILAKRHVEPLGWKHEATLTQWANGHDVYVMKKERI